MATSIIKHPHSTGGSGEENEIVKRLSDVGGELYYNGEPIDKNSGSGGGTFQLSKRAKQGIIKYSDGYWAEKIPDDNALLSDIKNSETITNNKISSLRNDIMEKYVAIIELIEELNPSVLHSDVHIFTGNHSAMASVFNIYDLYDQSVVIALRPEIIIHNNDDNESLEVSFVEFGYDVMTCSVPGGGTQKYELTPITNISVLAKGNYDIKFIIKYV